jgi:hypothetical protein
MNAHRATEVEVMAVPAPRATYSYSPLAHRDLIHGLEEAVDRQGLTIYNREYSLARDGRALFGVWDVTPNGQNESVGSLGFRNSGDKSLAVGLVAGTRVIVCSNLQFSGEYLEFHKHTSGLSSQRLAEMYARAVATIMEKVHAFMQWHRNLHNYEVSPTVSRLLSFCAVEKGILAASRLPEMIELVHNPKTAVYEPTVWGWHGGVTQILRDRNLVGVQREHAELTNFINEYVTRRSTREAVRA